MTMKKLYFIIMIISIMVVVFTSNIFVLQNYKDIEQKQLIKNINSMLFKVNAMLNSIQKNYNRLCLLG